MTAVAKLLPCPFCGSQPKSGWQGASVPGMEDCGYWGIDCCNAFAHAGSEQDAAAQWNRRAISARASAGEGGEAVAWRKAYQNGQRGEWRLMPVPSVVLEDANLRNWHGIEYAKFTAAPQPAQAGATSGGELIGHLYRVAHTDKAAARPWESIGTVFVAGPAPVDGRRGAIQHLNVYAYASPATGEEWRCFHCDEAFTDRDAAAIHFGTHEYQRPACLIDAAEYRRMEAKEARYAEEDADCHRAMHRQASEHQVELQRAEEAGYAKGLRDSGKCPCATPPAHGDGEGDYAAKWFAECRRVLEDVSTEMRATGRGDTRFRRLIESMPRQLTTRPTPEAQEARDAQSMRFNDAEALASWLESLHECDASGAVGSRKWDAAQRAATAIRRSEP